VKAEVRSAEDEEGAADEDDLNELDDEEEQKEEEEDEAEATTNIVLAQFEKVREGLFVVTRSGDLTGFWVVLRVSILRLRQSKWCHYAKGDRLFDRVREGL
jgi:hypothetical protein